MHIASLIFDWSSLKLSAVSCKLELPELSIANCTEADENAKHTAMTVLFTL